MKQTTQYACAVLLIISSIALVFIHEYKYGDVASGILMYVAQAFLLAGSIFGLDCYIHEFRKTFRKEISKRIEEQQPSEHQNR